MIEREFLLSFFNRCLLFGMQSREKTPDQCSEVTAVETPRVVASASTPVVLKSALKRPATGNSRTERRKRANQNKRRHSVCFDRVQIREYDRLNDGSGGVPTSGTYALGLGWGYREDPSNQMSIAEYECERAFKRSYFPMPLSENRRRTLLEKFDPEHASEGAEGTQGSREMKRLIHSRKEGSCCSCPFGGCIKETCSCFQAHMPCTPEMCECKMCANPYVRFDTVTEESLAASEARINRVKQLIRSKAPSSRIIKAVDVPLDDD